MPEAVETTPKTKSKPETPEHVNEVKIEDAGPARKRLTITIPAEAVTERLEESMGTLATETSLPGFRRGKAPRALLERRFGTTLRGETKNQLMADAYSKAIEEHGLKPVGAPEPDAETAKAAVEAGKPLRFTIEVEVVPHFEMPSLDAIQIKRPMMEITDQHVHDEIARHGRERGAVSKIDGPFAEGDRLVGHATVTKEGQAEPVFESDNVGIICPGPTTGGRGQVLGLLVEKLADLIDGKRTGDTITIHTTGPEAHEREDLRGAKLTITFQIKDAQRVEPASLESIIQQYGLGTEENLRAQVRLGLEQRRDVEQAAAMREQVGEHLVQTIEFDLPEKLSAAQAARTLERQRIEMLYRGVPVEELETRLAEIRADTEVHSRNRLKLQFILMRLAGEFDVKASEQEINGRIASIAVQRGERPAALRAEFQRLGRLEEIAEQIREHKTLDRLVAKARVTDISAEEWNKVIAAQAAAAAPARRPAAARSSSPDHPKPAPHREPAASAEDKPAKKPVKKAAAEKPAAAPKKKGSKKD